MTKEQIEGAAKVAGRFLITALNAIKRIEGDALITITGSKETAACRRASMDLTRALADLRRSPYDR